MRRAGIVAVGGAAGASIRWGVAEALPTSDAGFPVATLLVNLLGCLAIGLAARRVARGSDAWLGVVVGGLGGLTTFSAFAVETEALLATDRVGSALTYVAVSTIGGVAATELARGRRGTAPSP